MQVEDTGGNMISAWSALFVESVLVTDQYAFHLVDLTEIWVHSVDVVLEILVAQNVDPVEHVLEKKGA